MNEVSAEFIHAFEAIKLIREKWTYQVEAEAVDGLEKTINLYYRRALSADEATAVDLVRQMRVTFIQFQERYLAFLAPEKRPIVYTGDADIPEGALVRPDGEVSDDDIDALIAEIDALLAEEPTAENSDKEVASE